ncbi:unnamed protein product [Gongylonema pulchrum]|uniref:PGA_cap domain-containing protein n=1 Tax=Gongylonema pulchrum TaxID=637853 RepID=A0A183EF23_9BILA|nr:unnamed protein product [Gongylonema pulchrum]
MHLSNKHEQRSATPLHDTSDLVIRYGGVCLRKTSPPCPSQLCQTARIRKIAVYKRFMDEGCIRGFDFAIAELESDLRFDGSTSPICLPNGNFSLMAAYNLYDFGFGENELGEKMSRLNYGSAMITAVSQYHDFIRAGPIFSSNRLQGFFKQRAYLIGIHSFGPKFCDDGAPFTVTDVRPYAHLICRVTGVCYQLAT